MTLQQFRSLSGDLQREVVLHNGVFLLSRTGVDTFAKLYQVDGFYVEFFFSTKSVGIHRLTAFDDTSQLAPYLRQLDLTDVQMLLR